MSDLSLRDRLLAYALLGFITPARARLLVEHDFACNASASSIQSLLSIDAEKAEAVKNPLTLPSVREQVERYRASAVTLVDEAYPERLRNIFDPPLALFYRGNPDLLGAPSVAMVGSRRASPYGLNAAQHLAKQLASTGIAIVSGLARGIDGACHEAALEAGGTTIAVLGTGIDVVYPRSNARLFRLIEERGVIVTELPPGSPPLPPNFPVRNRIISGLSLGTVIVEATGRSGSLITARTAAEQGREVFAVPGSIFAAGSEGPHRLAQYGAKLVHDANDVLDELPGNLRAAARADTPPSQPLADVLGAFAKEEATHIDDAARKLRATIASMSESVLQLELGGWLRALPGSRYVRVK